MALPLLVSIDHMEFVKGPFSQSFSRYGRWGGDVMGSPIG